MNKHDKIFVAGTTGLVGSAITKKLLEKDYTNITGSYITKDPSSHLLSPQPAQWNCSEGAQRSLPS